MCITWEGLINCLQLTCSTYRQKRTVPQLSLGLALLGSYLPLVSNAAQLAEPQAINLLMHRVIADHLYRGANRGCIAFQGEGTGAKYVHIAVREDHHPWCGGDPNVEPVIDRFVVDFDTGKIFAVDILAQSENDLVAYRRFKTLRRLGRLPSAADGIPGISSNDGPLQAVGARATVFHLQDAGP